MRARFGSTRPASGVSRYCFRMAWSWLLVMLLAGAACAGAPEEEEQRGQVIDFQIPTDLNLGKYRALLIGINEYQHWPSLQFAEGDARDLRELLMSHYGFPDAAVSLVTGSEASERRIMNEIYGLLRDSTEQDNVLIYYAGHGQLDPLTETGYWIPQDGGLRDESTWIPFTTVKTLMMARNVAARRVLVITDSCYGGALQRSGPTPGVSAPSDDRYTQSLLALIDKRSRQVIASGGYEAVPDRSDFAQLLKQALRDNQYPLVDLEFLFFDKIFPDLRQIGQQNPVMSRLISGPGEDGQFILRRLDLDVSAGTPRDESGDEAAQRAFWDSIQDSGDAELFEEYLTRWPQGLFAAEASQRLAQLRGGAGGDQQAEVAFWNSIRESQDPELFQDYLERWPNGTFALIARKTLERLSAAAESPGVEPPAVPVAEETFATVPRLIGLPFDEAQQRIESARLKLGAVARKESARPRGTILDQAPDEGQRVDRGMEVKLVVSTGGIAVPEVEGRDLGSAERILREAGLRALVDRYVEKGKPGVVLRQVPRAGTLAEQGGQVLLVASGVRVPSVVGSSLDSAVNTLKEAGFAVDNQFVAEGRPNQVVRQDPPETMVVAEGTLVELATGNPDRRVLDRVAIDPRLLRVALELPAPKPLSPAPGAVFDHFPRVTELRWEPVDGAESYGLEIEFLSGTWRSLRSIEKGLPKPGYRFSFVGAQPGRWRVWAIDSRGRPGKKSDWREFRYTR